MKKLIILLLVLLTVPIVTSISIEEASEIGSILLEKATVGHRGYLFSDFQINILADYEQGDTYSIIYEVSANSFGDIKKRVVMLEIDKETGKIEKLFLAKKKEEDKIL